VVELRVVVGVGCRAARTPVLEQPPATIAAVTAIANDERAAT